MSEQIPILEQEQAIKFNDYIRHIFETYPHFLEIFHKLGRSMDALEVYDYLLSVEKPVTVEEIRKYGCSVSENHLYKVIKNLRELGLVASAGYSFTRERRVLKWVAV